MFTKSFALELKLEYSTVCLIRSVNCPVDDKISENILTRLRKLAESEKEEIIFVKFFLLKTS